jgi:fructose-bisphosphate aldolase / 2-amino-3,7-dideoxy-D-threo-hept-6-ulosonate synthase
LSTGKQLRMKRLIDQATGTSIICALDHGMTSPVFLSGLYDTRSRLQEAIRGGAHVFMLGPGLASRTVDLFTPRTSLALMLTASAAGRPAGSAITPINSIDMALRYGADAVVVYVALAGDDEREMISYVSRIAEEADARGMPLIAEAEFPNAYQTLTDATQNYGGEYLQRNARLCAELGADIVKVNWSGDIQSFRQIVSSTPVPVVVAGGTLVSDEELLTRMAQAVEVGAIGCSVGRNIFEHQHPEAITKALCRVIRDRWSVKHALEELGEALAQLKPTDHANPAV